jgi:hypothetical protein
VERERCRPERVARGRDQARLEELEQSRGESVEKLTTWEAIRRIKMLEQ